MLLKTGDGEAMFDKKNGVWEVGWKWKSGEPPTSAVGSGIGEYSRKRLADDQEAKFRDEIAMWIDNEWLGAVRRKPARANRRSSTPDCGVPGTQANDTSAALSGLPSLE